MTDSVLKTSALLVLGSVYFPGLGQQHMEGKHLDCCLRTGTRVGSDGPGPERCNYCPDLTPSWNEMNGKWYIAFWPDFEKTASCSAMAESLRQQEYMQKLSAGE